MLSSELLTDDEQQLIHDIGKCWGLFKKVMAANGTYPHDHEEIIHHIHVLQRYVMSNAAARGYPGKYRPIGGSLGMLELGDPLEDYV